MPQRYVMGTFLSVSITGEDSARLTQLFLDDIQHLEKLLSIYRPESEVSQINRAAGHHPVTVSKETFHVTQEALRFAEKSGGAFDPTLQLLGYRQVRLDPETQTVFLASKGMKLNLGGIGKGFALDQALARIQAEGKPESVSADFGGQLLLWHKTNSFGPETVLVEDPVTREIVETFQVTSNCSISTSSNAERPGHLRNPRTREQTQKTGSTTVVARTGIEAEALSTTFFIEGRFGVHALA